MHLTFLLFHSSVLYSKLIKKQTHVAIGVRILMTSYTSLYHKVSIASITVIFVKLLF